MDNNRPRSIVRRVLERIFPSAPDFYTLLASQAEQVAHTVNLLVDFMESPEAAIAKQIKKDEHTADTVKVENIHTLNEAFSTPIDRNLSIYNQFEIEGQENTTVGADWNVLYRNLTWFGEGARSANGGGTVGFVSRLSSDLAAILPSTYLGGGGTG